MHIELYNTLSGKKEEFKPLEEGKVKIYSCGPTVYDVAHIGNLRTFIMNDLLRRSLSYLGLNVEHVMNITDVDDKMIKKSQVEGISLRSLADRYEEIFWKDFDDVGNTRPHRVPHATDFIDQIIELIDTLIEKGAAYKTDDGIYFDIAKAEHYGALAKLDLSHVGKERIQNDNYDKENPRDFALWKFYKEEDGDVVFEAPFGKGRPGWHIECSAMAMDLLGSTIDIHTGGVDLVFPHHTNEIAQSEAATGARFVREWFHTGFVNMANEKMSKSIGNVTTLEDIRAKHISPLAYRYLVLTTHYRSSLNFKWEALEAASKALERLVRFVAEYKGTGEVNETYKKKFLAALEDDLSLPTALAVVFELIDSKSPSLEDRIATILDFDKVFGFNLLELSKDPQFSAKKSIPDSEIPKKIKNLIEEREDARKRGDWNRADQLRNEIFEFGYKLEDSDEGPKVTAL